MVQPDPLVHLELPARPARPDPLAQPASPEPLDPLVRLDLPEYPVQLDPLERLAHPVRPDLLVPLDLLELPGRLDPLVLQDQKAIPAQLVQPARFLRI